MSYTNGLDKPTDYFNTVLYTGDGNSTKSISGVGFQLDWNWTKCRSTAYNHIVMDSVRGFGTGKKLSTNVTTEEGSASNVEDGGGYITTTSSDGYDLGTTDVANNVHFNKSGETYASWNWLAGGTASSNTDGSITSSVSANTTAGFSIVSYTGTGSNATVGHGLGVKPSVIIIRNRSTAQHWTSYWSSQGATKYMRLNSTQAVTTESTRFNNTEPTSSVFSIGTNQETNENTSNIIAYCFAEKKGFSKFGSYTANANTDGPFVYTGFKPAYILVKNSTSSLPPWIILDNKRNPYNQMNIGLKANASDGDSDNSGNNACDFLSNGFKVRAVATGHLNNASGDNNIYMAFAESPFVTSTGIPTTAR